MKTNNNLSKFIKKLISEQQISKGQYDQFKFKGDEWLPNSPDKSLEYGTPRQSAVLATLKAYKPYTFRNLFKTGTSEINKTSKEFIELVNALKTIQKSGKVSNITLQGGASAVKKSASFDNQKLANKRANNLLVALKSSGVNTQNILVVKGIVGKSTVRDSNEAKAEQFVIVKVNGPGQLSSARPAIDNTSTSVRTSVGYNVNESDNRNTTNYMFFSNLEQIIRQCELMLELNQEEIDAIISDGHDWADDHISEAKTNIDQVFDFIMNTTEKSNIVESKKKNVPTNPKLWKNALNWAKSRYDVCPSAYCNGAAVKRYNSQGGKWKRK
jgi:hypothetical protein